MGYIEDLRQEELNDLEKVKKLLDQVVHFGGFEDGYNYLTYHLKSNAMASKTMLIRGDPGCGKKTLVQELEKNCLKNAKVIHLNPYHHTEDYSAIRYISSQLNVKGDQIMDILEVIEKFPKQMVIVLWDFEMFCRHKQGLLYCLTDLTQKSDKVSILALTCSLDATENLEKRVRSRLNTIYYELSYPYRNKEEYIKFASLLLGGCQLNQALKDHLAFMWLSTSRSIRTLKRYLLTLCSLDKGKLLVASPCPAVGVNLQSDVELLRRRLGWLTRPQLDLLKVAVSYCCHDEGPAIDFTLQNLADYMSHRGVRCFDSTSPLAYSNLKLLAKVSLLIQLKPDQQVNQFSKFSIGVMPTQFKRVLEQTPEYHSTATDALWKKLS